jgi:hypothetical protein
VLVVLEAAVRNGKLRGADRFNDEPNMLLPQDLIDMDQCSESKIHLLNNILDLEDEHGRHNADSGMDTYCSSSAGHPLGQLSMLGHYGTEMIRIMLAPSRPKNLSYNESTDEPPSLISNEPVEIEAERPARENQPVEGAEQKPPEPPCFEE